MTLRVETQGISASPPGCVADPWLGEPLKKKKKVLSITKCMHPAVRNFNMKNYLCYFKMLAVEIQFCDFCFVLRFFFLMLDEQLISAIPAFKNSLKKSAGLDLFVQRQDCSLISSEMLDLILLPAKLMRNPLAGCVRKPEDIHHIATP